MASGTVQVRRGPQPQRGRAPTVASSVGPARGAAWIPLALGSAALLAGLGSRNKGAMATALTALAGVAVLAATRDGPFDRGRADPEGQSGASRAQVEVERSITIGKTADELRRSWLDPETLPRVMVGFATVQETDGGRRHWTIEGPLGRAYEWETEPMEDHPPGGIGWRSLPNGAVANEGSVRFRPAPADRGTVAILHIRFDPPGGALGDAAVGLVGTTPLDLAADGVLRRFKSLVETGEIPTTARQPAARADPR